MKKLIAVSLAVIAGSLPSCAQKASTSTQTQTIQNARATKLPQQSPASPDNGYEPPTAEEMRPMRPEYLAELAKIHEPPEMSQKPMRPRTAATPDAVEAINILSSLRSPESASHEQRQRVISQLLKIANNATADRAEYRASTLGAIAELACIDGDDPKKVVELASAAADPNSDSNDVIGLRARMYLKMGERDKALADLETIMIDGKPRALIQDDTRPSKASKPCSWGLADFDALGAEPQAYAAKGMYLSAFIAYGAVTDGSVKEADIRQLYSRSGNSWHSPIPHVLTAILNGLGSEKSTAGSRCLRANNGGGYSPAATAACGQFDESTRQEIRQLTMALVIQPNFAPALSNRASRYLELAQASYSDNKPSRHFFELAIADFGGAISAGTKDLHTMYCDRALALASLGRYQEAALGYRAALHSTNNGIETSPFVYQQLAGVYMKLKMYNEAAEVMTQAIMNSSGGGMDSVIFMGGFKAFRTLYPEYDLLPDEILADEIRRRYESQLPSSWAATFISEVPLSGGKITSSILPDLYALRGDAYAKAGHREEAAADYRRLKSNAWYGDERSRPANFYFKEQGQRNYDFPQPWTQSPPPL